MTNATLSARFKHKLLPLLIARDGGFICFYCMIDLSTTLWVYEHLDDCRINNDPVNLVLCCQSCNNKKPHHSEMKHRAIKKLNENKKNSKPLILV